MGNEKGSSYPVQPSVNPTVPPHQQAMASAPLMYPPLEGTPEGAPPPYSDVPPTPAVTTQAQSKSVFPGPVISQPVQQPYQGHTTVVLQQAAPVRVITFPAKPINITCHYCQQNVRTRTTGHATCLTWLLCGVLCGLGCFCGCCLIPFCTDGTRDIVHTCPNCKKYLGIKTRHT